MNKTNKFAAVGLTAGLALGGVAGIALAVPAVSGAQSATTEGTTDSSSSGAGETTRPEPGTRLAEALAPLVADGTLTQEQADKVVETLKEAGPRGGGPGIGHGAFGLGGGRGLDAAATALGMTADELRTELEGGQTIAQVAEAKGVDIQTVIDAMVAEAKTHLDEEVAAGDLTQEQADTRLTELTERLTESVDRTLPARGEGPGRPGHARGTESDDSGSTDSGSTDTTEG